jgi:hypothetical protein
LLYIVLAVISRNHRTAIQLAAAQQAPRAEFAQGLAPAYSKAA